MSDAPYGIAVFHGGPCDRKRQLVFTNVAGTGDTVCEGTRYVLYRETQDTYLALLPDAPAPTHTYAPPDDVAPPNVPAVHDAWAMLTDRIGRRVPAELRRVASLRAKIAAAGRR